MKWMAVALAAAFMLAGCSGGDDNSSTSSGTGSTTGTGTSTTPGNTVSGTTGTTTPSGTTSTTTGTGGNTPPSGSILANATTGIAPLEVSFKLDASDAEGDELSFTFDANGDGTLELDADAPVTFPQTTTFTYTVAGSFNATYIVSDGTDSKTINVLVDVTAPGGNAGPRTVVIEGTTQVPFPGGDFLVCIGDDIDGNAYVLDPAGPGWSYALEPSDGSFGIYWQVGGAYDSTADGPTGVVPDGIDGVEICNLTGMPGASYKMTLTEP